MAQNSNHFCLEFNFSSNFEPSQNFRTKKSEPTQNLDTWSRFRRENKEKLNGSNFEPSQSYACTESRVIVSFDDFLSHLRHPPVSRDMIFVDFSRKHYSPLFKSVKISSNGSIIEPFKSVKDWHTSPEILPYSYSWNENDSIKTIQWLILEQDRD